MGVRELKSKLNELDKTEIIKLVSEMYKTVPSAKNYLDIYTTGDTKELTEKYKKQIEKYIYPSGKNLVLKESEAKKLIQTVRKLKVVEMNIELELHYVDCCLDVIADFGYWDNSYYSAIYRMYNNAVNGIQELGVENDYSERLDILAVRASEFGIDFYY